MPSGRSGRSEGWARGAASRTQSELEPQFYPLDGNGENRCQATVPLEVRGPYTRTEGGELHGLLAPTSEAVHFPRALVERIPRSVVTRGLGIEMRGDDRDAPESPEDVVHHENRCACVDFYHMTGGCGCLRPAVEGSIFCSECRSEGCDCRCPQCRTSACTGVAHGCECGCCRSDRRGGRYTPASKALMKKEKLLGLGVCSGGCLPDSVLALRADRRGSALQEEKNYRI